jgi:hypothetical protein|tara:strand:+ start:1184 stop:1681 length:498 start_codon:yes stop_codon:yes gene_type:complete
VKTRFITTSIGIFLALSLSRFIPHPPNFTSLIALSFYVPAILGIRFIPILLISFIITDLIIGYHSGTHWTWGSVFLISLLSKYFTQAVSTRIIGSVLGALIFFIITNFGVWVSGMYGLNIPGFVTTYILAIPFFVNSLISTLIFAILIEFCLFASKKILIKSNRF